MHRILDLRVGHVGGEVEKKLLSVLFLASAIVGEQHSSSDFREIGCKSRLGAGEIQIFVK